MYPFNKIIFITENWKQPVKVLRIKGILKKNEISHWSCSGERVFLKITVLKVAK